MPRIKYVDKKFRQSSLSLIEKINFIINDYSNRGYSLTLRQLYYQLVAANIIPNNDKSYKSIGNLINDARLAGLIDWYAIVDRTRNLMGRYSYGSPAQLINSNISSYHLDYWKGQESRVEVWVEKDALKEIIGQACYPLDIDYFSCRGYTSQSEMWVAAERLKANLKLHERVVILHFGDHDPSGIDMSRDIQERLELFGVNGLEFHRMALNMDQVEEFNPPPNPAKISDSRFDSYIQKFGGTCWELDALDPEVITKIIKDKVMLYRDESIYQQIKQEEKEGVEKLKLLATNWHLISPNLDKIIENYEDELYD